MPDFVVYILYAVTVGVVVFLSMKLGKYVDIIDAKSNISGAFIGAVMLAAVTSLPELFTSLSAVWIVGESSFVIGNILGSNLINLAFMGAIMLAFTKKFKFAKFSKSYYASLFVGMGMYALVALGLFLGQYLRIGWFTAVSPLILVLYVLFLKKLPKSAESEGEKVEDDMTLRTAVIRFIICAVLLIGTSIAMTYLTDIVAELLKLGKTFAGALFLGIATSLPELISSITLCARGNFNASAGNFIGSNVFNFTILFVADMFSFGKAANVYVLNPESVCLLIFGEIAVIAAFCMLCIKNRTKSNGVGTLIGAQVCNAVPPVLYVLFLLLTTGVIGGFLI
ncbi:MAG: hypothetical protein J1F39_01350 [Clostridiales bacterium]|nr:hypothetical protein [Clostridiales bacterium]